MLSMLTGSAAAATTFYIRGGGYGHGIGMSQYGSYGYALHGKDYRWILAHYYQGTSLGMTNPGRTVRVLLADGAAAFSGASKAAGKQLLPGDTYTVRPNADGSLSILGPNGKQVAKSLPPLTVSGQGPLQLAGHGTYRGSLVFRPDGSGGVQTVEAVGLDDYVRGVIAAEMPAGWAAEALKVQAVAARTYAITTDVSGADFDVYPDTRSQMYGGVGAETPATDAAVAATRGQIVTYNGKPAVTYFFSSSGGYTENIENVWPGSTPEPWLRGVPDQYDGAGGDPYHHWGYDLSMSDAAAKLAGWVKGSLVGIQVTKHGASPRILTANVVGTKGTTSVTGTHLQQAFGLLTTYAAFTTITTLPGGGPVGAASADRPRLPSGDAGAQAVAALIPLVRSMVAGALPALHGSVFPAAGGATVAIQEQQHGSWQTVTSVQLQRDGSYQAQLPGSGTYRVVYRGIDGPAVSIS